MQASDAFTRLWSAVEPFSFPENPMELPWCAYAKQYLASAEDLCARLGALQSDTERLVAINQAKVRLLDRYYDWKAVVPKAHRIHLGEQGHRCLYLVLCQTYERLRALELSITPPLLFLPEPPSPPVQVAGIFLGER